MKIYRLATLDGLVWELPDLALPRALVRGYNETPRRRGGQLMIARHRSRFFYREGFHLVSPARERAERRAAEGLSFGPWRPCAASPSAGRPDGPGRPTPEPAGIEERPIT
ncbi:MAG TPA: hypothetical protein VG406_03690 [Isosphaeraceae bacterium]|jgi:hypothetical protein|nr:hypothetical protein [Isosphaeraceae bacterium]